MASHENRANLGIFALESIETTPSGRDRGHSNTDIDPPSKHQYWEEGLKNSENPNRPQGRFRLGFNE
jgi:hypothetical protein